jgi:hypothetical protein
MGKLPCGLYELANRSLYFERCENGRIVATELADRQTNQHFGGNRSGQRLNLSAYCLPKAVACNRRIPRSQRS